MVSKQKCEFAVIFANKSLRNKLSELLLQIKIEAKEAKQKEEVKDLLNSLKFPTSFLIVENKLLNDETFQNDLILYFIKNKEKYHNLPIISINDENEEENNNLKSKLDWMTIQKMNKKINKTELETYFRELKIYMVNKQNNDHSSNQSNNKENDDFDKVDLFDKDRPSSKYEYISLLGKGEEGIVNLVKNLENNKIIALKVIDLTKMDDKEKRKIKTRLDEFGLIECPTIIQNYEIFEEKNKLYIAMEYASGGMLSDYIKNLILKGENIPIETLLNWMCYMLVSLKYLSKRNITHRDIKSDNLILVEKEIKLGGNKNHNDMICKFIDFGTAKIIENVSDNTNIGTPFYMAPELILNIKYDSSVDIWSFGVVIYELLTKKKPFHEIDCTILNKKICTDNPQETLNENYNYLVRYILLNVLKKNPTTRMTLNEILSIYEIKNQIKSLYDESQIGRWEFLSEVFKWETILCPLIPNIIPDDKMKIIQICYRILENTIKKVYQKSYLSSKIDCFKGDDIISSIEEIIQTQRLDMSIETIICDLYINEMIECISNTNNKEEFEIKDNEYYIFKLDTVRPSTKDNPLFGNINSFINNTSLLKLTEYILYKGISIVNNVFTYDEENNQILYISDSSLILEFMFGISQFNKFDLMSLNDKSPDYRHATLLNLYQIMYIHYLINEKANVNKKKGILSSFINNNISIDYQFKDVSLNNLELRFGIFRNNTKPIENYLKICSSSDIRLSLSNQISFSFSDYLLSPPFQSPERFIPKYYLFRVFDDRNVIFQLDQYVIDFINEILIFSSQEGKIIIPIIYQKYFDFDFKKEEGFFTNLSKIIKYNDKIPENEVIYKLRDVNNDKVELFRNYNLILKNISQKEYEVEFL